MPIGDAVDIAGIVLRDGRRINLYVDGGGYWELQLFPSELWPLGRRVRVRGVRSGFNIIDVQNIESL